ncbi:hypothetical protein [Chryseobacterium gossypii]|uniref:hypothetical protein n=1 Tax=Chryseobacterium gossypii TaxID=3231602 RepID=UPI003526AF71
MKKLKKLSRKELENLKGSGPSDPSSEMGDCGSSCSPGDGYCEQFGLSCGIYMLTNGQGQVTSSCFKCM